MTHKTLTCFYAQQPLVPKRPLPSHWDKSLPRIDLRQSSRYVTQEPVYDRLLVGAQLGNARIRFWALRGKYGSQALLDAKAYEARKRQPGMKRPTAANILSSYNL